MTSSGNSGSSCLTPASLTPGHVGGGEHPDDARARRSAGAASQRGDPGVRVRRLHRVGVQDVLGAAHQVVGVERVAGDVQRGALVRARACADDGRRRGARTGGSCRHLLGRGLGVAACSSALPEHRRAVARRWPGGRRSACPRAPSTPAAARDGLGGPRPALERGLGGAARGSGWRRRRRARSRAVRTTPSTTSSANADRDAGDVVEPPLGDLVERGERGERQRDPDGADQLVRAAARSAGSR